MTVVRCSTQCVQRTVFGDARMAPRRQRTACFFFRRVCEQIPRSRNFVCIPLTLQLPPLQVSDARENPQRFGSVRTRVCGRFR